MIKNIFYSYNLKKPPKWYYNAFMTQWPSQQDVQWKGSVFDWVLPDGGSWTSAVGDLKFLGSGGSLIRLSTSPESWATMSGWKRFIWVCAHTHRRTHFGSLLCIQCTAVFLESIRLRNYQRSLSKQPWAEDLHLPTWPLSTNMTWITKQTVTAKSRDFDSQSGKMHKLK